MKVRELIEKLKQYDQEMQVIIDPNSDTPPPYREEDIIRDILINDVEPILARKEKAQCKHEYLRDEDQYGFSELNSPDEEKPVLLLYSRYMTNWGAPDD